MNKINLVGLIDLYSKNSDGTQLTRQQLGSWAELARNPAAPLPVGKHVPHSVPRRLGGEVCAEIVRRYSAGETAQALAIEHSVSRNAILNLLRENSVVVRRQPPTVEQKRRFAKDYEAGATIAEIAARTGFSHGAVWKSLRAEGTAMRPRGKRSAS